MNSKFTEKKQELLLFCSEFPYGTGEPFLETKIKGMAQHFKKVHIIPMNKKANKTRPLPYNVVAFEGLFLSPNRANFRTFFCNFFFIFHVLFIEFLQAKNKRFFFKNIRQFNSLFCQAIQKSEIIRQYFFKNKSESYVVYSFWMDDAALLCSILKKKGIIPDFVFRVHGFDLYSERWDGNYIPFQYFNMQQAKAIFTVSEFGCNYLKRKDIFPEKIFNSYLGVFDKGVNPFNPDDIFTIVSCSSIIPLKRVYLLVDALKNMTFPIKWIHFGDGPLFEEIKTLAKELPSNVRYDLKGWWPNEDVIEFYKKESVNLFVLLSETEGLSYVLQEAASFGIPMLSTNAGGNSEIVSDNTGILIDVNCSSKEIAELITNFKDGFKNTAEFRKKVREFWNTNLNAKVKDDFFLNALTGTNANSEA